MAQPNLLTTTQRLTKSCKEAGRPFAPSHHKPPTRLGMVASRLGNQGAGGRRLVLPGRGEDTDGLVVAGQTVDTRLDENEAELGVLVLAVALKVLADGDSLNQSAQYIRYMIILDSYLLDKHVQVLRNIGSKACSNNHSVSLVTKQRHSPTLVSHASIIFASADSRSGGVPLSSQGNIADGVLVPHNLFPSLSRGG